jgi:hypothetical protein
MYKMNDISGAEGQSIVVIDAPQSGLKGLSQTLNKTIKMRYNA